jgi:hypothetical protein
MTVWTDTEGEILPGKWNPLEDGPMLDHIPSRWDSPHVIQRYTEALGLLKHTPLGRIYPKLPQTCWPAWEREWDALMARCHDIEAMSSEGKVSDELYTAYKTWETDANWSRHDPPTAQQIKEMDHALSWPARYLLPYRQRLLVAFLCLCDGNAKGIEPRRVYRNSQASRSVRLNHRDISSLARAGGAIIARGLNDDNVGVF